jgi:7-alpha-hydroxysteroid dehydrogenase
VVSSFDGKVGIVTGAGRGIGRQIARDWANQGAQIVCAARSEDEIRAVAEEINASGGQAVAQVCDIRSAAEIEQLVAMAVDQYGGIDLVANNAGAGGAMSTMDSSEEEILDVYKINALGPLHLSRFAIPHMLKRGGGAIVNISSGMAVLGDFGGVAYGAAKAALEQTTRMLAFEFAPRVRVNAIRCGSIETSMLEGLFKVQPEMRSELEKWTPANRLGRPEDISAAATFLCSEEASFITGAILDVDGGLIMGKSPLALSRLASTGS